ncbi:hypothetical protein VTN77DRAFT_8342 [Rasamsonia byssochlamydoides]|uniref:uncharacterized protein n=1 Tax=Rasamsonia byssochlamydoides TaxID=89139 RepID=UPI003743E69B
MSSRRPIYFNATAASETCPRVHVPGLESFHKSLPNYAPTPLISLPSLAAELGVRAVLIKDESNRFGLPSFKILGASWAVFQAVTSCLGLPSTVSLEELSKSTKTAHITLFAASEGNHGRAVAFMARILSLDAHVFVPKSVDENPRSQISAEGAHVHVVDGDYDLAVKEAAQASNATEGGLLIQDTSFPGYEKIPSLIVEGYSTMLNEVEAQLADLGLQSTVVVTPVGVGSLAQAVALHCKSCGRPISVVAVEPDTAACLYQSLNAGKSVSVKTSSTIMDGMCCGTLSVNAWDDLRKLVDASVTVSCYESHYAVQYLASQSVAAGPCGGATVAALRYLASTQQTTVPLNKDAVVVLLSTEGPRSYPIPADVSIDDPVALTQTLVRIDSSNPTLSVAGGAGETKIADYIAAWLEHRGIENYRVETNPGRPSIVGVLRGTGGGKSLMLNGHSDTVSLASYERDPLSGEIAEKDGRQVVVGRGSLDMKGGLAAAMAAMSAAKASGDSLCGDVILAAVADEEDASLGTKDITDAGWRADAAVIPEPTMLELIVAHKGFVWVEVDILGVAAHGSKPELGVDSILHAGWFLSALEAYQRTLPTDDFLGPASLHCGLIRGGEEPSSYPAKCTVTVEFRTIPCQTEESILHDMKTLLADIARDKPAFRYAEPRITLSRPTQKLPADHPLVQTTAAIATPILGRSPPVSSLAFWCDAALLSEVGVPAIVFGPAGAGLHSKEEYVEVESIKQTEAVLVELIREFCR